MRLEVRRRESQAVCAAGPLIRNTDDSALGQNCFSSPIDVGGVSEHLMETYLGKIGGCKDSKGRRGVAHWRECEWGSEVNRDQMGQKLTFILNITCKSSGGKGFCKQ